MSPEEFGKVLGSMIARGLLEMTPDGRIKPTKKGEELVKGNYDDNTRRNTN